MSEVSAAQRYAFITEWFDCESALLKKFYLFFFPFDETIELFDIKNRRIFLKRTTCPGATLNELFVGNTIEIFSRQMKIIDHADEMTKNRMSYSMQKTFALIKPDGVVHKGSILRVIYNNGFKVSKLRMAELNKDQAMQLYHTHSGKSYLPYLIHHMTSGPLIAMELVAENAVTKWRSLVGPCDPEVAKKEAPHTVRACYGRSISHNAVHGAQTLELAKKEIEIFFPTDPTALLHAPLTCAKFENTTCCIIKPCAIKEGKLGDIISIIADNNFEVTAMQMFYMDHNNAEEFYEVYKGVVSEYPAMISHLVSGPCVALEIYGPYGEENAKEFRKLVGPADPDIAQKLRPSTIRARFGKDKVQNAVHVTDLPQDAPLEVQYFFKILTLSQ